MNGDELTLDELRFGLRQGMLTGRVCPVMCGSAMKHIGTAELLNRLIRYMPDASQKVMMGTDKKTGEPVMVYPHKPFTGFVFKTLIDPFSGKLSYVRVFSGELKEGDKVLNVTQNKEEKSARFSPLSARSRFPSTRPVQAISLSCRSWPMQRRETPLRPPILPWPTKVFVFLTPFTRLPSYLQKRGRRKVDRRSRKNQRGRSDLPN